MGNIFTSLLNSTNALDVFGKQFSVIQNNISNANTPGYVKQDLVLISQPFDITNGISGGVAVGAQVSARSPYLEQSVRNQQEFLGHAEQRTADLAQVELQFDLTSQFGIPTALNNFFAGFSELSVNPNDAVARQSVLDLAKGVVDGFHQSAIGLSQVSQNVDQQTTATITGINRLAGRIAAINKEFRGSADARQDAGLDAQLHNALEELSNLTNYTLIRTADGGANVYLGGGQSILVIGSRASPLIADLSGGSTAILDGQGADVTALTTRGRLGALVEEKNITFPAYIDQLNTLAASFADQVNTALAAGLDQNGATPAQNLFTYTPGGGEAFSLAVNSLTPDQIAAALPTAPGGNGNAILISQLAQAQTTNGFTFTQYYGHLGAQVGRDSANAQIERSQYQDTVAQSRQQRAEQSSVSLDEEAARLLQFQQAYQAVGKLVRILDELTQTVLDILR